MQLLILYFSGTGNTHYVAGYLARQLEHLPLEIRLQSIEQSPAEAVTGFDVLALGFPVYECDAPPFFREYLRHLPPGEGRGAFVFCTKGAFAGNACRRNLQRLASRGYVPLGAASVGMPGTDGLAFIPKNSWPARMAQRKDYDHLKSADRLARRMEDVLRRMLAGESARDCEAPLPLSIGGLLTDWLWRKAYELFTDSLKRRFYADERCTRCQLCVQICPARNIWLYDSRIQFADRCYLCMRCIHQCPQEAVQIGRATLGKFRWRGPKGSFKPLGLYGRRQAVHQGDL